MPLSGATDTDTTNDAAGAPPSVATPTRRVTRSAFKTPPGQTIAPPRSPPGAPVRPARKLVLGP